MVGHYIKVNDHDIFGYSRYIHFYNDIVQNASDGDLFVELGSFLGQSTAAMGYFIKASQKQIKFDAVDLFEITEFSDSPHEAEIIKHGGDFLKAFKNNIELAGVADVITPIKAESKEAAKLYKDRSISFLMIDASHTYDDVIADIKAWYPKVKLGGIISGDDYDWKEVAAAVNDTLGKVHLHNNSTWFTRKQTIEIVKQ